MRILLALAVCTSAYGQRWEQPRQEADFYAGGSYQVGVEGSPVYGMQVRANTGRFVGVGAFYNFSPVASAFGANGAGTEIHDAFHIHDYGLAVEVHAGSRIQPYILGTIGLFTARASQSRRNYNFDVSASATATRPAYGGGVGVRFHLNKRMALFVESRLMRPAVSDADYFIRATAGVSVVLK